ncbi:MAG TPA: permease-like cell division protein FtsX [Bacillota bacterium]|nr:permease-like cell division protein FtsX [Bacillota bacterium]
MKLRSWNNIIKDGLKNTGRNRVMTMASIGAIMAALFVLGIIVAAIINLNSVVASLESKVEITIYMKKEVTDSDIREAERQINSWDGIGEAVFISKEEALKDWQEEMGEQSYLLEGYNSLNNPLPDTFLIRVEKTEFVEDIVGRAKRLATAEEVRYSSDVVENIGGIARTVRYIGLSIVILLSVMSIIIINNTIKMSVHSRRREINIMKYIGATDWYIRWPFLIEGLVLGLIGATLAGGATAGVYTLLLRQGDQAGNILSIFDMLPLEDILYPILILYVLIGCMIGAIASALSMRRYLDV